MGRSFAGDGRNERPFWMAALAAFFDKISKLHISLFDLG